MTTKLTFRQVRKRMLGWTQTQMGEAMGVTRRTIARYEAQGAPDRALKLAQFILKSQKQ